MAEFLTLQPPGDALSLLLRHLPGKGNLEWVEISNAVGRYTAEPLLATASLPAFPRSMVDGYALHAVDTYGASDSMPAYLNIVGEVPMGATADIQLSLGNCALIHTGGMLPEAADAVVMLEHTQMVSPTVIEIMKPAAQGENVIHIGEDVEKGQEVIPAWKRLGAAEIGGLAALGIRQVAVMKKPRVAIISSGDEVVPLDSNLLPGQVYDVNSYSLSAFVEQNGGQPVCYGIFTDHYGSLVEVGRRALEECDIVAFTAGSSVSTRDLTARVIGSLGTPGVLVHGVNVRPGKPTILGVCGGKAVFGLPGNPVSALVIAGLFITPVIQLQLGVAQKSLKTLIQAKLMGNVPSQAGREEWIPVKLVSEAAGWQAEPVFGKSNLIFTLVRADGLVRVPADVTGLQAGEKVEVSLFM